MNKAEVAFNKLANLFHVPPGGKSVAQLIVDAKNIPDEVKSAKALKNILREYPEAEYLVRRFTGKTGAGAVYRKGKSSIRFDMKKISTLVMTSPQNALDQRKARAAVVLDKSYATPMVGGAVLGALTGAAIPTHNGSYKKLLIQAGVGAALGTSAGATAKVITNARAKSLLNPENDLENKMEIAARRNRIAMTLTKADVPVIVS
ncbi:MAG TPA: hypothetical protein PKN48_00900 [Bacteroidales bacterium]|nr:hypothetical protein [Bacteroidales bacterium]